MPRLALIIGLLMALIGSSTCWAQTNRGYPTTFNQPGRGPSTPGMLVPPGGSCYQPMLYESPLSTTYVTADLLAFRRDWQASQTFATLDTPTNGVLGTHALDFTYQPGLRLLGGWRFNDTFALEGTFLGLLQWNEARAVRDLTPNSQGTLGDLFSPLSGFGNPAQVGLDFNSLASLHIQSQFNSGEINLRQRIDTTPSIMQVSALYGFRYLNIHERLAYRTQSFSPVGPGTANAVNVTANNSLVGLQVGGMLDFRVEPRCWLSFEGKALLLDNDSGQQTQFTTGPLAGGGATISGQRSGNHAAFGGDLAGMAVWKIRPAIVLRIGYQGIFLGGLSLASDNFVANAPFMNVNPNQFTRNGHLAFHGPFTGVTVTW